MRAIRVVIADDQPLVRAGLRGTLTDSPRIEIVGEAEDGVEAVRLTRLLRPDVVLVDIGMPRMNGVEATRLICSDPATPTAQVLILTVFERDEYVFEALRAGASGFLLKTTPTEKVVEAITTIVEGGAMLAPTITRKVITEFASRPTSATVNAPELTNLTARELDVFKLLICGYHNDEIARRMVVCESTVKSHVQSLYRKLGVRDRVQVVIYAYERGLLSPRAGPVPDAQWQVPAGRERMRPGFPQVG